MSDWNRKTFRPGQAGNYDELNQQAEAEQESKTRGDEGRGEAAAGGRPAPVPGDELYDAITYGQGVAAEKERRADIVERRDEGFSLVAMAAAAGLVRGDAQDQAQSRDGLMAGVTEQTRASAMEAEPGEQRMSYQALRAERAEAQAQGSQPVPATQGQWGEAQDGATKAASDPQARAEAASGSYDGLMAGVSDKTIAAARSDWQQNKLSNNNTLGL